MKKLTFLILLVLYFIPKIALAQTQRFEDLRGNRNILTVEEAEQIGSDERPSHSDKIWFVAGALVLLGVAGYAAVQLAGMSQKPKLKK